MENGFNIIIVIAIILFARLGVRLILDYKREKNKAEDNTN